MFDIVKGSNERRKSFSGRYLEIPKGKYGYLRDFCIRGECAGGGGDVLTKNPVTYVPAAFKVLACGKNLFNQSLVISGAAREGNEYVFTPGAYDEAYTVSKADLLGGVPLLPETFYTLTFICGGNTLPTALRLLYADSVWDPEAPQSKLFGAGATGTKSLTLLTKARAELDAASVGLSLRHEPTGTAGAAFRLKIQLEKGTAYTGYEEPGILTSEVEIKDTNGTPCELYGLKDGTCDEVIGNKLIKRVKKVTTTANFSWSCVYSSAVGGNTEVYYLDTGNRYPQNSGATSDFISTLLPSSASPGAFRMVGTRTTAGAYLNHYIPTAFFTEQGVAATSAAVRAYINSLGPVELYYDYAAPAEKEILPVKIRQRESDTLYMFTDCELQPVFKGNAVAGQT
jgi:hypothetical protein